MPIIERNVVLQSKDANGNETIDYPFTKIKNVDRLLEELQIETQTITLQNTLALPFNSTMNSPVSVTIQTRNNANYTVETDVIEHTGNVGDIFITNKTTTGFKIAYDGSASSVKIELKIRGGFI